MNALPTSKQTVASAAVEALTLRGEPLTARQTLETILQNGLYSFGAAKPLDVVRRELKRHSGGPHSRSTTLEAHPNGRYFLRGEVCTNPSAVAGPVQPGNGEVCPQDPPERQTIIWAIKQVMTKAAGAMTVDQVYRAIIRDRLYQFKASEPIHVVRSQIRRHSLGIDFPTASDTKHFEFRGGGRYRLLTQPVTQKSRLSHIGLAKHLSQGDFAKEVLPDASRKHFATERRSEPRAAQRQEVFVSYSHRDEKWMRRLQVHLAPLERNRQIVRWDDTRLQAGERWRKEIASALCRARIAILLVSADFLASPFIIENELPPLLKAVNSEGVRILPVIVSPCRFEKSELGEFQSLNPPSKPLNSLQRAGYERVFVQVADAVEASVYNEGQG